eukprot:2919651-Amphidinium_carterae.1
MSCTIQTFNKSNWKGTDQKRDYVTEEYQRVLQTLQFTQSKQYKLQGALEARKNEVAILRSQLQQQQQLYKQQ